MRSFGLVLVLVLFQTSDQLFELLGFKSDQLTTFRFLFRLVCALKFFCKHVGIRERERLYVGQQRVSRLSRKWFYFSDNRSPIHLEKLGIEIKTGNDIHLIKNKIALHNEGVLNPSALSSLHIFLLGSAATSAPNLAGHDFLFSTSILLHLYLSHH